MKKKVFRERYNIVNGEGKVLKEEISIEDMNKIEIIEDKNANTIKIEKKTTKRGKKNVKSN